MGGGIATYGPATVRVARLGVTNLRPNVPQIQDPTDGTRPKPDSEASARLNNFKTLKRRMDDPV